jgi:hypothetical protein
MLRRVSLYAERAPPKGTVFSSRLACELEVPAWDEGPSAVAGAAANRMGHATERNSRADFFTGGGLFAAGQKRATYSKTCKADEDIV